MKTININNDYGHSLTTNYSIPNKTYWSIPSYVWNTIDFTELEKAVENNKPKKEEKHMKINMPKIKNIDFQPPLTVVIWEDGTKTFVKCAEGEVFDPEKGAAMAIAKKALGDKYNFINTISYYVDKWLKKDCNKKYITENSKVFSSDENKIIEYIRDCKTKRIEATKFILDLAKDMKDEYNKRK